MDISWGSAPLKRLRTTDLDLGADFEKSSTTCKVR